MDWLSLWMGVFIPPIIILAYGIGVLVGTYARERLSEYRFKQEMERK